MSLNSTKRRLWAMTLGAVLTSGAAWAGLSENAVVTVNTIMGFASGGLQAARSSADAVQYIKCTASIVSVSCEAKTSAGTVGSCTATSSLTDITKMREAILSINAASYVNFLWDAGTGECEQVNVTNSSTHTKA